MHPVVALHLAHVVKNSIGTRPGMRLAATATALSAGYFAIHHMSEKANRTVYVANPRPVGAKHERDHATRIRAVEAGLRLGPRGGTFYVTASGVKKYVGNGGR
jgi:hypothetical protein